MRTAQGHQWFTKNENEKNGFVFHSLKVLINFLILFSVSTTIKFAVYTLITFNINKK